MTDNGLVDSLMAGCQIVRWAFMLVGCVNILHFFFCMKMAGLEAG